MTDIIDGRAVAEGIRNDLGESIETLKSEGVTPGLATVLMSDDPASETYVSMKQRDCEEVGINGIHIEIDPEAPAEELYDTIDELNADPDVHGILVQMPVPDHVDSRKVLRAIDAEKDADVFHPENVGHARGQPPQFKPCTPHGVQKLLESADVDPEGKDVVIVGRSNIVGKPLANLLIQQPRRQRDGDGLSLAHHDLAAKTREADVVVAACGVPELIDESMLSNGVTVIDVGVNRVDADNEKGYELVGDVDFESAKEKAGAITPVPGGVGPMTRAMLLYNTVKAAGQQEGVEVELP